MSDLRNALRVSLLHGLDPVLLAISANVAAAAPVADAATATWIEQRLDAADGATGDDFGYAVSISADTAVVGAAYASADGNASQGVVYVYTLVDGSWMLQQRFSSDDGVGGDGFGFSVSVSGDTLLVGAPYASIGDNGGEGAAYVFTRSDGQWSQAAKLDPDDGAASYNFGWSVALSGGNALVSAPVAPVGSNALQGKAYVFAGADSTWAQVQALIADDGTDSATFGSSVALDGTTAVIGAAGVNGYFGAAYVFDGSSGSWLQSGELVPADGVAPEFFGISVGVSGDRAIVGAYYQRVDGHNGQGSAYVYAEAAGAWTQQQKLVASDGAASARFGLSVGIDAGTAVVGAYFATVAGHAQQGAAYLFTEAAGSWTQTDKLVASDGTADAHFGNAVAIAAGNVLVGAFDAGIDGSDQGAAYVYSQAPDDSIFVDGFDGGPAG